ncbi:shikimate dehydrogenase [Colwellia ponticola]|uniref:Shikimate dehydrogenase (NADP(+)) n=1 Tax=Colwellia ponticola TaxID=2304625 RepID=A0A8H2PMK1_9GAMM|nr:shikimate dehydrogenase [Colwellia ponticola]TMM45203.1 shikimate dehydrogenase [Colwellia ponticola]
MTQQTLDQYRVFGNPIAHSRSPDIHHIFAHESQQNINYQKQLVDIDGFANAVTDFIKQNGKGANVTVPFKEQALALSDELTERARLAGAVNTLSFVDGKIKGDNTDGEGLVQDLLRNNVKLKNSRILLLGAGGAAKGVILPLLAQQPQSITVANRTFSKAEQLCLQFADPRVTACGFSISADNTFDLIINATSASLSGQLPPIPAQLITPSVVCYDMVYGKTLTPFLVWAKQQGANQVIDGLGMLVGQAAVSFSIWRGVTPAVEPVISALRHALEVEA